MHCAVIIEQFVYLFDTGGSPSLRTSSRSDDLSATAWLALGDLDSACWANNFIRDCVDWFKVSAISVISFLSNFSLFVVIAQQLGMKPGQQTLVRASGRRYGKP